MIPFHLVGYLLASFEVDFGGVEIGCRIVYDHKLDGDVGGKNKPQSCCLKKSLTPPSGMTMKSSTLHEPAYLLEPTCHKVFLTILGVTKSPSLVSQSVPLSLGVTT